MTGPRPAATESDAISGGQNRFIPHWGFYMTQQPKPVIDTPRVLGDVPAANSLQPIEAKLDGDCPVNYFHYDCKLCQF